MIKWIKQIFSFKPAKQRKHYTCSGGRISVACECQTCKLRIGRLVRHKSSNQLGVVLWWHKGMAPPMCLKVRFFIPQDLRSRGYNKTEEVYSVFEKDVEYLDEAG